ncbi:MAG TPA: glycosyltransferase family 1 protein [Bacteriovoracaceae bacterium]|nr:glycosyltransferase family 1 protein [Bacteriovoracaceae bacterium]
MKIGFNGRPFCTEHMRGLSRHTLELIKQLKQLHPDWEFYIYTYGQISSRFKQELPFVHIREDKVFPKIMWDLFSLRKQILEDSIDIFHSTNNLGVPLLFRKKIPLLVTIHDHFTHSYRWPWGKSPRSWWAALNYRIEYALLKRCNHYFSVSENARKNVSEMLSLPLDKITVSYNGANLKPTNSSFPGNYFLYVGGLEARKNVATLINAFIQYAKAKHSKLIFKMVADPALATSEVQQLLREHTELFQLVGNISDKELGQLYEGALALVFPSLEEGFGLPLVEAMGLGCPVIASDIDVFKEISGDAALFFPAMDQKRLQELFGRLESDSTLRESMKNKGYIRAKLFNWQAMANTVNEVYSRFCS